MCRNQQTQRDNHGSQQMGKGVRSIRFMPGPMRRDELALFIHVCMILGSRMMVDETHERAVRYERDDAIGLVVRKLESTNPYQHYNQPQTQQSHSHAIQ